MIRFWIGELTFSLTKLRYSWFGAELTSEVKSIDGGVVSEEAFYENDEMVGYYAYGHYDPDLPYQGQEKVKVNA